MKGQSLKNARKGLTVAIDGPAGAGKSTVAREVARELAYALVDTGAIYRAVALLAQRASVAWNDDAALTPIVATLSVRFFFAGDVNRVVINEEDLTDAIRTPEISRGAAEVSTRPPVRAGLLGLQRSLAGAGGAVLEGRDIGTVVCPDAPVKFFLFASAEERARRRFEELQERGDRTRTYEDVLQDQHERDALDQNRAVSPLRPALDAIMLDSTAMPVESVIRQIVQAVRSAEAVDVVPKA